MPSPSLAKLESVLDTYLKSKTELTSLATISPVHPSNKTELAGKGRIVIGYINDTLEGSVVTRHARQPSFQFLCYDSTYGNTRRLLEKLSDVLDSWSNSDLNMVGQKVTGSTRSNTIGCVFEPDSGLFMAATDYRFYLTLI